MAGGLTGPPEFFCSALRRANIKENRMTEQNGANDRGSSAIEAERIVERLTFSGPARWMIILFTLAAISIAINQLFNLRIGGYSLLEGMYLYVLAGLFLSLTFITFRAWGPPSPRVPWYDWLLAAATVLITGFFVHSPYVASLHGNHVNGNLDGHNLSPYIKIIVS